MIKSEVVVFLRHTVYSSALKQCWGYSPSFRLEYIGHWRM